MPCSMLILTWVGIIFVNILIPSVSEVLNVYKYNAYPCQKEHIAWHDRIISILIGIF